MDWKAACQSAALNWNYSTDIAGESRLRDELLLPLSIDAQEFIRARDFPKADEARAALEALQPLCSFEPLATAWDLAWLQFHLSLAEAAAQARSFDLVYRLVGNCLELLAQGDRRRADQGRAPRPNSELRWVALQWLAMAKWQDDRGNSERVLTPGRIVQQYRLLAGHVRPLLPSFIEPGRAERLALGLDLAGLEVGKMALRFCGQIQTAELLSELNAASGWGLRLDDQTPLDSAAGCDWEIARLWIRGQLSQRRLEELHRGRALQSAALGPELQQIALSHSAEFEWMSGKLRRRELRLEAAGWG